MLESVMMQTCYPFLSSKVTASAGNPRVQMLVPRFPPKKHG